MRASLLTVIALWIGAITNTMSADNKTDVDAVVARCFFIYAPLFEAAKKLSDDHLFIYSQKRLAYVLGYQKGRGSNSDFERVFDRDLAGNKAFAQRLESDLLRSVDKQDAKGVSESLGHAKGCDLALGLPVSDIPEP